MPRLPDSPPTIGMQVKKLRITLEMLRKSGGLRKIDVMNRINNGGIEKKITQSDISKMLGAGKKHHYRTSKTYENFKRTFEILDEVILAEYGRVWNWHSYTWEPVSNAFIQNSEKLNGLVGYWRAFTWDKETSEIREGDYIHSFKIDIRNLNDIHCVTKGTTFEKGFMRMLSSEKIMLQISHRERRVVLFLDIGSTQIEDIKRRKRFMLAYLDSGTTKIKSGFAIVERTEKKLFTELQPDSLPISTLENEEGFLKILKDQQLVMK